MSTTSSRQGLVWTMAGGDATRGRWFPDPVKPARRPDRRLPAAAAVQAGVVFDASGRAFVADMAGWVQAFDADRHARWRHAVDGAVSATPAVDPEAGRLIVATHRGVVEALATSDGSSLWQRRLPSAADPRILSDVLVVAGRGRVVLSSWGGKYHSLDMASGEPVQEWEAGLSPGAGPAADRNGNVYCVRVLRGQGVSLVRVAAEGGETELHREPEGARGSGRAAVLAAPVIDEARGRGWFVANDGRGSTVLAWETGTGRLAYRQPFERTIAATPALAPDGSLRVADMKGTLHLVRPEPEAGVPAVARFETEADYLLAGPVCDAEGRTFLGDPLGRVWVVEPDGCGRILFETPRSLQARPSFDRDGNLYMPGGDGAVNVFRNTARDRFL